MCLHNWMGGQGKRLRRGSRGCRESSRLFGTRSHILFRASGHAALAAESCQSNYRSGRFCSFAICLPLPCPESHAEPPPPHPTFWTSFPHAPRKILCLAVSVTSFTRFDPPLRAAYLLYFHLSHAPPPSPLLHSPDAALTSRFHTCLLEFASM